MYISINYGAMFHVQMLCSAIYYDASSARSNSQVYRFVHYRSFSLLYRYSQLYQ